MTESSLSTPSRLRRIVLGGATLLLTLALPFSASAQNANGQDNKTFSPKVSENLSKLQPLVDARDWDGALAVIDQMLSVATPGGSYEQAVLNSFKGTFLVQKEAYEKAIEPLETALHLTDQHNYLGEKQTDTLVEYLMQLYYTEAGAKGRPVAQQQLYLSKAIEYLKRNLDRNKKPDPEKYALYSTLLYNRAMAIPDKPDKALILEAQKAAEQGLMATINPKEQSYAVLLATLQHQGDFARMAELLEVLAHRFPKSKNHWEQLFPLYYTLATDDKLKLESHANYIRAILTVERAQKAGFLNAPKDNFNLVTLYFTIGQFDRACELLEAGLKNGTIERSWANWNLLAYSYQQVNKELKAIDVLKQAAAYFPTSGEAELQAANIYYSLDKLEDAYKMAQVAAIKGIPGKDWQIWYLIAYCAFELRHYDDALAAANKGLSFPEAQSDQPLPNLKRMIEDKIKEREIQDEILKRKQKK